MDSEVFISSSCDCAANILVEYGLCRISELVSDADLMFLVENLDEKTSENEKWETVIDKRNNLLSYSAKCCKPKVISASFLEFDTVYRQVIFI